MASEVNIVIKNSFFKTNFGRLFLHRKSIIFRWRQESSAKTVLNQISATKTLNMIKLFAYKNGDGRLKSGEMIVGSSIPAVCFDSRLP